ncbi:MAG: hypothetical protein FJ164_01610 [Gammaproteobacteria bacterium]|nr:hypothetical protein [Gammaproteobacteria bacterium]
MKRLSRISSTLDFLGLLALTLAVAVMLRILGPLEGLWLSRLAESTLFGLLGSTLAVAVSAFGLARVFQLSRIVMTTPDHRSRRRARPALTNMETLRAPHATTAEAPEALEAAELPRVA